MSSFDPKLSDPRIGPSLLGVGRTGAAAFPGRALGGFDMVIEEISPLPLLNPTNLHNTLGEPKTFIIHKTTMKTRGSKQNKSTWLTSPRDSVGSGFQSNGRQPSDLMKWGPRRLHTPGFPKFNDSS